MRVIIAAVSLVLTAVAYRVATSDKTEADIHFMGFNGKFRFQN